MSYVPWVRWVLLTLLCVATAILAYGLLVDWQVGTHFRYEWDRGLSDGVAHWCGIAAIVVVASVAFSMLVTARRMYTPRTGALIAGLIGVAGLIACLLALRRIASDPGYDERDLYVLYAIGAGDELEVRITRAPVVMLVAFAAIAATGISLFVVSRAMSEPVTGSPSI